MTFVIRLLFSLLLVLSLPHSSIGAITFTNGYWGTSFEAPTCQPWQQNASLTCDEIDKDGDWMCNDGVDIPDEISNSGNMAAGAGGMGFRHYVFSQGNNGGGVQLVFTATDEFWLRFYIRNQSGIPHQDLYKILYIYGPNGGNAPNLNQDNFGYYEQQGSQHTTWYSTAGTGWNGWYGAGQLADGTWHEMEYHLKLESSSGATDGVIQIWDDGVLVMDEYAVEHGTGAFTSILIGSNIHDSGNSDCVAIDYDDMAMVNSATSPYLKDDGNGNLYIGPLASGGSGPVRSAESPTGQQPAGTTQVILSVDTDGSSDTCTYGADGATGGTYPLTNSMTDSGTHHTATITGLTDGGSYSRNVMCTDGSTANDTDHIVSWTVAASAPSTQVTGTSPMIH